MLKLFFDIDIEFVIDIDFVLISDVKIECF